MVVVAAGVCGGDYDAGVVVGDSADVTCTVSATDVILDATVGAVALISAIVDAVPYIAEALAADVGIHTDTHCVVLTLS